MFQFKPEALTAYLERFNAYTAERPDLQALVNGMREGLQHADHDIANTFPLIVTIDGKETAGIGTIDQDSQAIRLIAIVPPYGSVITEKLFSNGADASMKTLKAGQTSVDAGHEPRPSRL